MCVIFCRCGIIIADISKDFKQNAIKTSIFVNNEQHKYALFQTKEKRLYFSALFLSDTWRGLFLIAVVLQHNTDYVVNKTPKVSTQTINETVQNNLHLNEEVFKNQIFVEVFNESDKIDSFCDYIKETGGILA